MTRDASEDERDALIARLERENAHLVERIARLTPALHGLTEDLVRARREAAEWRRRYRAAAPADGVPSRVGVSPLPLERDAA